MKFTSFSNARGLLVALFILNSLSAESAKAVELKVPIIAQQSQVWCWVAASEMVFRYYGVPNVNPYGNYQCGIVGIMSIGTAAQACNANCALCQVPARDPSWVLGVLNNYPSRAALALNRSVPAVSATYIHGALSPPQVRSSINAGNPLIAGVTPNGQFTGISAHVIVIAGYRDSPTFEVLVNDPFPYAGGANPYLMNGAQMTTPGQYWIAGNTLVANLHWAETFLLARAGSTRPLQPAHASRCCFSSFYGPGSCPLTYGPLLAVGQPCTCSYPNGARFGGAACP